MGPGLRLTPAAGGAIRTLDAHYSEIGNRNSQDQVYLGILLFERAFEHPEQRYAILDNAPALNIDRHNRARIVHRDRSDSSGFSALEPVEWWNAVAGSAQVVIDGTVTLPEYGVDLVPGAGYGAERSWYAVPNARSSMVGLSRDNRVLTLFTIDQAGGSESLMVGEAESLPHSKI